MTHSAVRRVFFCAALCLGLLFDTASLLRMTLLCAAFHEAAHIGAYCLCVRHLPKITVSAGGISLNRTADLSASQERIVLLCGPFANFLLATVLGFAVRQNASYGLWFLLCVSFCTGCYNLLPFGVLDGARLLKNSIPARYLNLLCIIQTGLLRLFCAVSFSLCIFAPLPFQMRIALFLAAGYLLTESLLCS
ncbi:MAG: hypothetical protein RSD01_01870 [Ruthenibacterium sp.]